MDTASTAGLVGREPELARIEAFFGGWDEGAPASLLIEGEAGIGKTTLWHAGVERAQALGMRVVAARPSSPEQELSFAGLGDLFGNLPDEIGGLPEPQRRALRIALLLEEAAGEPPEQRAIGAAVLGLLRRIVDDGPIVVALDDVHWLDASSANALRFALRRLEAQHARILATCRPDEPPVWIGAGDRVVLGPLPYEALDALVRDRLGARLLRPTLRELERASGGNPFYALEIAASFLRSGRRLAPGEPLPVPVSLREAVLDRLQSLTPGAREAALATAALAQPTTALVESVASDGADSVLEAVAASVIEPDGELLRLTHPLLAAALLDDCPPDERRDLHRRLGDAVQDPEERARHLAEAARGPDDELASALEAAAASVVARGAPDTAARLAMRAFELTPLDRPADAHRRHLAGARYTFAAGDPYHAARLLERQLRLSAPGRERAEVELELGKARLATHGAAAARECFERALALNELDANAIELKAEILIGLADVHVREQQANSTASEQAVALAEQASNPDVLARALGIHGVKLVLLGRYPPSEYWDRAIEIERRTGEKRYLGPTHAYTFAAFQVGDLAGAAEGQRLVAASMRRRGDPMLATELLGMSEAAGRSGDWDVAARLAREAHDIVVQTGRESEEPDCFVGEAQIALLRGDLERAGELAEEGLALVAHLHESDAHGLRIHAAAHAILARIAQLGGKYAEAHTSFDRAGEAARTLGSTLDQALAEILAGAAECLVALGRQRDASDAADELLELAGVLRIEAVDGLAARAQGLVTAAGGDQDAAIEHLERAVDLLETMPSPWPFELARTLLALGTLQRRTRQKLTARGTLDRALELFDELGARLWSERTRSELSQIGGRPLRTGALTATEQAVADLVAAGRTNAEVGRELFLSPKTVEWNLSKIYRKLHVRSRAELAARLAKTSSANG